MTRYTNVKVQISERQKDKLKKAFESNWKSTTIRLTFSDVHGEDIIAITNSQLDSQSDGMGRKERHDNKNVRSTIGIQHENRRRIFTSVSRIDSIPNRNSFTRIRSWAISGLASTRVQILIGNGLYLKKRNGVCRI